MPDLIARRLPVWLYWAFVFGLGGLALVYLVAPIVIALMMSMTLEVGPAREIILGQVVGVHVRSDAVNPANLHIDQMKMDAVGRLGGHSYTRTRDQFDKVTLARLSGPEVWGGVPPRNRSHGVSRVWLFSFWLFESHLVERNVRFAGAAAKKRTDHSPPRLGRGGEPRGLAAFGKSPRPLERPKWGAFLSGSCRPLCGKRA